MELTLFITVGNNSLNDDLQIIAIDSFQGSIDNVSAKQIDPDNDWTKGTGWTIQDDQAQFSGSADAVLEQESVFTSESKYKVSIDVAELSGGELQVKDDSSVHQTITSAGGYEFTLTATGTTLQLNIVTGSVERTVKINSITVQEVSSTTSLAINSIGEAIFTTGNKFSLLNINNNTTYDLTINANQSANDTTLTITAFEFEAIVPVGSIVTFNKKNLIKEYQDDTLQEVTDRGNTTTNSIMIGSSSAPDQLLHIAGLFPRIKLQDTDATNSSDNSMIEQNNGVLRFRNDPNFLSNNSAIQFDVRGTERVRIDKDGNVGIGTSSPSEKLEVTGDALVSGDVMADTYKPASSSEPIKFKNSSSTELARITDAGTLLINSTVPAGTYKLQVVGKSYLSGGIQLNSSDRIDFGNAQQYITGVNSTSLSLVTGNSPTLTALHNGNVLIGTTFDFGHKLQVQSNTNPQLFLTGDSGAGISFIDTDTSQEDYQIIVGANDMVIRRVSDASDRIRIYGSSGNISLAPNSGNVGIGLTNPETKLDVNGTCTSELLQLKRQESAPSDPAEDRSIIYMDSSGDIKVKINVGGTTVTRTLATYA